MVLKGSMVPRFRSHGQRIPVSNPSGVWSSQDQIRIELDSILKKVHMALSLNWKNQINS